MCNFGYLKNNRDNSIKYENVDAYGKNTQVEDCF